MSSSPSSPPSSLGVLIFVPAAPGPHSGSALGRPRPCRSGPGASPSSPGSGQHSTLTSMSRETSGR
eukprot:15976845-Heterocapsa_arctica.AAC.1